MSTTFQTLLAMCDSDDSFVVNRKFVRFTGSLEAGIILTRLMMWTQHSADPEGWVYKSDADWQRETCLKQYGVRQARTALEMMGVVETCVRQVKRAPTIHYRIKPEAMVRAWRAWLRANPVLAKTKDREILRNRKNGVANPKDGPFEFARTSLSHERHARKTGMSSSAPVPTSPAPPCDDDDFLRTVFDLYRDLTGRSASDDDRVSAEKLRGVTVEVVERVMVEVRRRARKPIKSIEYFVEEILREAARLSQVSADDEFDISPEAPEVGRRPPDVVATLPRAAPSPPAPTRGALALSVAPEFVPIEISVDTKRLVWDHVRAHVIAFNSLNGRDPKRDELRAHLVEWCLEARLDVAIVDAMYPASTSPPPKFPAPALAPPAPVPTPALPAADPGESAAGETERRRREFLDGLAALRRKEFPCTPTK